MNKRTEGRAIRKENSQQQRKNESVVHWAHGKNDKNNNDNLWIKSWRIWLKMAITGLQLTYYFSNGLFLKVKTCHLNLHLISFCLFRQTNQAKKIRSLGISLSKRKKKWNIIFFCVMEDLKHELLTTQWTKSNPRTQSSKMFFSLRLQREAYLGNDFKPR